MEIALFGLLVVAVVVLVVTLVRNSAASKKAEKERKALLSPEELYTSMVSLVASGKYQEAFDLWNAHENDEGITLQYKDLANYYHYAAALKGYIDVKEVCLNDVKTELEQVPPDFKRAAQYQKEVAALGGSVCGRFIKKASAGAEYQMKIDPEGIADILYIQPQNYVTVHYIKQEKVTWAIEAGILSTGRVSGGPYFFELTPVEDGMQVEDRRRYGNDLEMCGVYLRQEEEEEKPETDEADEKTEGEKP